MLVISAIFGVPTHPLVVHAAVVLVPLAAVALVALGWRKEWRSSYALPIALLALAGAGAAFLADQTGESIQSSVRSAAQAAGQRASFGEHPEQGQAAAIASMVFAAVAVGFWAIEQWKERLQLKPWMPTAAYAIGSLTAMYAIAAMVIAGHSGAVLVWKDVGNFVSAK